MKTPIELLEQLESELTALRTKVYRAHSPEELTTIVNSLVAPFPAPTVALENRSLIQSLKIEEVLKKENCRLVHFPTNLTYPPEWKGETEGIPPPPPPSPSEEEGIGGGDRKASLWANSWEAVRSVDIGIGGADYALADTGTLVLFSAQSGGRWVSLAPTIHICLLPREKILSSLDDLFSCLADPSIEASRGSAITFITGPSRTADIELTLVMGAHGPKELHVIILLF
jgi:L-lactate utilization protein LutC